MNKYGAYLILPDTSSGLISSIQEIRSCFSNATSLAGLTFGYFKRVLAHQAKAPANKMILALMKFTCALNRHDFVSPNLSPYCYGEFFLRSETEEMRHLNAIEDKVFTEVESLILLMLSQEFPKVKNSSSALHAMFGQVACDPDSDGNPFEMNRFPSCPLCGTNEMAAWDIAEPPEAVNISIAPVTHERWYSMNESEKRNALREALLVWMSTMISS